MQLLPCHRPFGSLEPAPRTSLRADTEHERWEGFWSDVDERYYARCSGTGGTEQWYRIADERPRGAFAFRLSRASLVTPRGASRDGRRMVFMASKVGGRSILVGTSRRRPRGVAGAR